MTGVDVKPNAAAALDVWLAARTAAEGQEPPPARIARVTQKLADPTSLLIVAEGGAGSIAGMTLAEEFRTNRGAGLGVPG